MYSLFDNTSLTRIAEIAPAGFGKSTVQFACALKAVCYADYKEILLISASAEFAEFRLRKIRSEIENNDKLRSHFGIAPSDIWTSNEILLNNGVRIYAKGKGGQVTGYRPDLILADDIETESESRSEVERARLKEWWYSTLMSRPAPGGRIIIIGSISNKLAWMNEFTTDKALDAGWVTKTYSTKQCHSIWAEKWSDDDLRQKKVELAAFPGIYEALYESDVSQIQKYTFQKKWLRYYTELPKDISATFVAVDPAVGMAIHNDYTAIIAGVSDTKGNIYITRAIKKRFNVETLELFGALFALYDSDNIAEIGIESIGFQKFIKVFFEQECIRRNKYPVVKEIKHEGRISKEARISSLAPLFQRGQIYIKNDMYDLISEYEAYPETEHDDLIDALSILKDMIVPVNMLPKIDKNLIPRYKVQSKGINF
jgi:predicted phage terminase large subunit-like protein